MKHKWRKVGEDSWVCDGCGVAGAAYDPNDVITGPCPGAPGNE